MQFVESQGDFLLSNPFHLVGFGNGACIAAAFAQRWGSHPAYANSIRSLVSVNGFLCPDPQLTAILHSASELFENTTHSRPDVPVAFWSRFIFSEDYLNRVSPNLALNIYTAVSNPVTNEGRTKVARGALQHRDMRGGLAPDLPQRNVVATVLGTGTSGVASVGGGAVSSVLTLSPVQIPVVILQSTENLLVNASNVDSFLTGRGTKHLWSHQLNLLSAAALSQALDTTAHWVGKMSSGPHDYAKYSILGKPGLRMLLEVMGNPRGAFVMWTRTGHCLQQENKTAVLDLLDVLAMPSEEYVGELGASNEPGLGQSKDAAGLAGGGPSGLPPDRSQGILNSRDRNAIALSIPTPVVGRTEVESITSKMEVMFKLNPPPKKTRQDGRTLHAQDEDEEEDQEQEEGEEPAELGVNVVNRQMSTESKGDQDNNEDDDDDDPIDYTSAAPSHPSQSNPTAPSQTSQSNPTGHVQFRMDTESGSGGMGQGVDPTTIFDKESLEDITSFFITTTGSKTGALTYPMLKSWDDVNAMFDNGLVTEETLRSAWQEVSRGGRTIDYDGFLRLNVRLEQLMDERESMMAQGSGGKPLSPRERRGRGPSGHPSLESIPSSSQPQIQSQPPLSQPTVGSLLPSSQIDVADGQRGVGASSSSSTLLDTLQPQMATEEQKQHKEWTSFVPQASEAIALEAELARRQKDFTSLEEQIRDRRATEASARLTRLEEEQTLRRQQYEDEDKMLLEKLQLELDSRRREREAADKQRRLQIQAIEQVLVEGGLIAPYDPLLAADTANITAATASALVTAPSSSSSLYPGKGKGKAITPSSNLPVTEDTR